MARDYNLKAAPKSKSARQETVILTRDIVKSWKVPPFQRPLTMNARVRDAIEDLNNYKTIALEGVITLGQMKHDPYTYIVDGQHRLEIFIQSVLKEVIAELRTIEYVNMAEMADDYVRLNTALVRPKPDDLLKGLESSTPALSRIREQCPFIGYSMIRRGRGLGPIVSMNQVLKCWVGSNYDTPVVSKATGPSLFEHLDGPEVSKLIEFMQLVYAAWGRDPEYYRLWASLNLTVCMWLYRMIVLSKPRGNQRYIHINNEQFRGCAMALSADPTYCEWLGGRILGDRDRNPCYQRVKAIFARRLMQNNVTGSKPRFPQPTWSSSS